MPSPDKAWFVVPPLRLRALVDLDIRAVPVRWQGWAVVVVASLLVLAVLFTAMPSHWPGALALLALVLIGTITLTYMTGHPVRDYEDR